jgi:hypothetical protein
MIERAPDAIEAELEALRKRLNALESSRKDGAQGSTRMYRRGFSSGLAFGLVPFVGALLLIGGTLYGQNGDALFIDPRGWIGIGTNKPNATLDVAGKLNVADTLNVVKSTSLSDTSIKGTLTTAGGNVGIGVTSTAAALDVAGKANTDKQISLQLRSGNNSTNFESNQITFGWSNADTYRHAIKSRHNGGEQRNNALDFYLWRYDKAKPDPATIGGLLTMTLNGGNVGIGTADPGAKLDVDGVVRAKVFSPTGALRNRMYPNGPIVYQEIFDAKDRNVIAKLGNPAYDESSYRSQLWNDRHIIRFGGNNETDGNGLRVTIPAGYDTVWIRVLGERWNVVRAYFLDGAKEDLGQWTGGRRSTNSYSPDGTLTDSYQAAHQWVAIPAGRSGELALISKPQTNDSFWISGIAFSKNPWAHAAQSALGYHWRVNGGEATVWVSENWNNDILSKINPKTNLDLKVPVVPSGRDKLLYLVEHNSNWNGTMHTGITVNGTPIQRFMATYDNPFARHWNSKIYERYVAAYIPAALIAANTRYLSVRIDMSKQDEGINFREIGTHDVDIPWAD